MQIIITQSEIEQAVTDYVKSHINVRDNQTVTVDFTSTRGPEGSIKATIDISSTLAPTSAPVQQQQHPAGTTVVSTVPTPQVSQPTPKAEKPEKAPVKTVADIRAELAAEEPADQTMAEEVAAENQEAAIQADEPKTLADAKAEDGAPFDTDEQTTASPRKSLFAGLSKPKN